MTANRPPTSSTSQSVRHPDARLAREQPRENAGSRGLLSRLLARLHRFQTHQAQLDDLERRLAERTSELERTSATLREEVTRHAVVVHELKRQKEVAEAACVARTTFLASVSHEIRTSLNGIVGVTNLIQDTSLDAEQADLVHTLRQAGEALHTITNDILDLSKIEAGCFTLERIDFDLIEQVQAAIALHAEVALRKELQLIFDVDASVPRFVRGDPVRLRQVIVNLIGNALKFTPRGKIILKVRLEAPLRSSSRLRFEVIDTGIGIPESVQATLFQPYAQAESSTSRRYGGTGLGLAICKHLVSLMHGDIGVRSELGKGSTFWFIVELDHVARLAGTSAGIPAFTRTSPSLKPEASGSIRHRVPMTMAGPAASAMGLRVN